MCIELKYFGSKSGKNMLEVIYKDGYKVIVLLVGIIYPFLAKK